MVEQETSAVASLQNLQRLNELLHSVTKAQSLYFRDANPRDLFGGLLDDLLALTESDYGYIAEVLSDDDGNPYLKTWAITNIAWNDATRALYDEFAVHGDGLEFRNLETLFGWGLLDGGRLVIANDTTRDDRISGRPEGHPPLKSYLGVPIIRGGKLIGQFGVSNRALGYDDALVHDLEPFTVAVGNLIDAYRSDSERRAAEQAREEADQHLQERTAELTALVGALSDGVLFVDAQQRVVFANEQFCRIFGYSETPMDLVGTAASALQPAARKVVADPIDFAANVANAYYRKTAISGEAIPLADGRILERDFIPIRRRTDHAYLWLYRDITARAKLDEERRAVLAQERSMRAVFEERNRSLLELNQLKNEFVATVSHELRTPLTSIVSFAELLTDDADKLNLEQRDFLEVISRNAGRLLALVGDLLMVARLESGSLSVEVQPTSIASFLEDALDSYIALAAEKQLRFTAELSDDPTPAAIDPSRFEQVVANLMSNAIKFTPNGGHVAVTTQRNGDYWRIAFTDTGIGIPTDEVSQLFERFYRGSNARLQGLPGTGLGLAITRAIVDLHGGRIEVSHRDVGTAITVLVPVAATN